MPRRNGPSPPVNGFQNSRLTLLLGGAIAPAAPLPAGATLPPPPAPADCVAFDPPHAATIGDRAATPTPAPSSFRMSRLGTTRPATASADTASPRSFSDTQVPPRNHGVSQGSPTQYTGHCLQRIERFRRHCSAVTVQWRQDRVRCDAGAARYHSPPVSTMDVPAIRLASLDSPEHDA